MRDIHKRDREIAREREKFRDKDSERAHKRETETERALAREGVRGESAEESERECYRGRER